MKTIVETPDQMLERLELMGLERVKGLLAKNHFEPKTHGLVRGWVARKEEALNLSPPATPEIDPAVQEAIRTARKALLATVKTREDLKKVQTQALIATVVAGAAMLVAALALFAFAILR